MNKQFIHPRLLEVTEKFCKKYGYTEKQAKVAAENFSLYFTPRWGVVSDRELIKLLANVAEQEGVILVD